MIPAELPPAASDFAVLIETASHPRAQAYYNQLHTWCIMQQCPNFQRAVIARFRKRNDAEDYLKALRRLAPNASYLLIFEVPEATP
jgi:hypothetical protein